MSEPRFKYRLWCKSCQDYTVHERIFADDIHNARYDINNYLPADHATAHYPNGVKLLPSIDMCDCGEIHTHTDLNDIPEDKRNEQRERFLYKRQVALATDVSIPMSLVLEDDAGYIAEHKTIEENNRKIKRDVVESFKGLGRNDKCLCDSGKKFKKCCLPMVTDYKRELKQ